MINGASDLIVFLGDKVSYKKNVTAEDDRDGEIEVSVDSGAVNLYEIGEYPLIYSAADSSSNSSSKKVTVSVVDLDPEQVYAMADGILAQIITDDMSLQEKAEKIHTWAKNNIRYTSSTDKSNTLKGAFYGFKTRQGDCFTFYAVSEVLLTRAGIPNMRVTRVGGTSQHYWNLIDVGTGWYHFDTCPINLRINTFMFTAVDAEDYTKRHPSIPNYYTYDSTQYPPIVGDPAAEEAAAADTDVSADTENNNGTDSTDIPTDSATGTDGGSSQEAVIGSPADEATDNAAQPAGN